MNPLTATVEGYLDGLEASWRRVADGEWGLTLEDVGGRPLHVGLALRDGVLRAQAHALDPDRVGDHELLHRNRGLVLARYTHAGDGTVWVEADLPPTAVDATWVDRLLGAVVEAATVARGRAGTETEPEDAL